MRSSITIQLKKDEIWIKISKDEEHTPIKVTGKVLKNKEMEAIEAIIKEKIDVEIQFETPTSLGLHGIKKGFFQEIKASETTFYKGSLRSGQKIEFEGSVVVLGDVNAGAEVIAGENIVIMGLLRGLAHAGAKGNRKAVIAANGIDCPQIRIADKIKEFEKEEEILGNYVYVNEKEEILLE